MRKIIAKTVSVALVCAMAATVASCGKTKKTGKEIRKISEDSPWFDVSITDVETGAEKDRETGTWLNQQFVASDDQYYFIETSGEYQIPPDDKIDWETYKNYQFDYIAVVDRNTRQTVNTIDLKKELTASEPFTDNIFSNNGIITVQSKLKERDYDPLTGELLDTRPRKASDDDLFTRHYFIGSYEVETIVYQTETNQRYSRISVKGPDGEVRENELKKPDKEMYINYVLADGDTKAVISVSVGRNLEEDVYYELDLETNKLTVADQKKYEWLDEVSLYNSICCPDGTIYFMDSEGVFKINAEKKTTEKLFDYNQCSLNFGIAGRFNMVECSEDRILLCGRCDNPSVYEGRTADKINFVELKREYRLTDNLPPVLEARGRAMYRKNKRYFKSLSTPNVSHLDSGIVDPSLIYGLGMGDTEIFRKKGKDKKFDGCAYILIDNSGSMRGNKRIEACKAAAIIEEGFKGLIPIKITAFDSSGEIIHETVKGWEESLRKNCCWNFCLHGREGCGNEDGYDIEIATKELLSRSESKKMLVILSDGAPGDPSHVKRAVQAARKNGIKVFSIYFEEGRIGCDAGTFKKMYEKDYVICELAQLDEELSKLFKKFSRS